MNIRHCWIYKPVFPTGSTEVGSVRTPLPPPCGRRMLLDIGGLNVLENALGALYDAVNCGFWMGAVGWTDAGSIRFFGI